VRTAPGEPDSDTAPEPARCTYDHSSQLGNPQNVVGDNATPM
jgi:hypothetical protein